MIHRGVAFGRNHMTYDATNQCRSKKCPMTNMKVREKAQINGDCPYLNK